MSGDDTARMTYLLLLGGAILLWFVVANRRSLGRLLQQAMVWGLIFIGAIAAFGMWDDIRNIVTPRQSVYAEGGRIELPRAPDGHYYLDAQINGAAVRFVVDTGASEIVLSRRDALAAGFDLDSLAFIGNAYTANGMVRTAPVTLDSLSVGSLRDTGLRAVVNDGDFDESLLGMSYLQRFQRMEIGDGKMILTR